LPARVVSFFLCLTIALLAACDGHNARRPGVLRIGLEGNPTNLDPRLATDAYSTRIVPLVYEGLLRQRRDGGVEPALAESYSQPDERTYRFVLRENVRWHDGQPLRSADVAATFRYLADPANGCPSQDTYQRIAEIRTPDERTVELVLAEPFAPFLDKMVRPLVPAHRQDPAALEAEPVGTGPYRLASFERGRMITLTANPDYWRGAPAIATLEFVVLANDTSRLLRLKKGDIDLVQNAVPPYAVRFFEEMDGYVVRRETGINYSYLGFNLTDKKGLVSDVRVRRAIAHAIDRERIIKALLFGMARPATGLISPDNWAYAADVPTYAYDPARAKALLDEAGFPDPDGDGPLPRFTLSYKTSTNKLRMRIAEVMAEQLAQVGVALERRSLEWGTFFQDVKSGNFQTFTLTWVGVTDPDHYFYVFHSSMQPPHGANRGRYVNAQVDQWLEESRLALDPARRRELFVAVQRKLAEDCVYVSLWWADNVVVHTARLRGFEIMPGGDYSSLAKATLSP